jgi:hypothetical protein
LIPDPRNREPIVIDEETPARRRGLVWAGFAVVVMAVVAWRVVDVALKRSAIRSIESLGGVVYFDDDPPHLPPAGVSFRTLAKELVLLRQPVLLRMSGPQVTDAALDDVLALGTLRSVNLSIVAVSDAALARLAGLRVLESLVCTRDVRSAPLFVRLKEPTEIDFTDVPLGDGLAYLADFHGLSFACDKAALAAAGLNDAYPVSYRSSASIELGDALDQMFAPYPLDWVVREGKVVVTTRQQAAPTRRIAEQLRRELVQLKQADIDAR